MKVAAVESDLLFGPTMPGFGGAVASTVQVRDAAVVLMLPAASFASTDRVWLPSASPEKVAGFVQAA